MSSGKSGSKASSGSISIGGVPLATSTLGKKGYSANVALSPDQQKIWDTSNAGISSALSNISSTLNVTPEKQAEYQQQLYTPVADQINAQYDKAGNDAYSRFSNIGGLNSLGFNRYNDTVLTKQRGKALSDAYSAAQVQAYDLPNILATPYMNALNAYSGTQTNLWNQILSSINGSAAGQQLSNQYNTINQGSGGFSFF